MYPTRKVTKASSSKKSLLLQMPQEIQDKIYEYAATESKPIDIRLRMPLNAGPCHLRSIIKMRIDRSCNQTPLSVNSLAFTHTAIAQTVLLNEMFWKNNEFTFLNFRDMTKYLRTLTPRQLSSIQFISVRWIHFTEVLGPYLSFLSANCTGLRELKFDITSLLRFLYVKHRPIKELFEEMSLFKAARDFRGLKKFELVYTAEKRLLLERRRKVSWFGRQPADFDVTLGDYTDWAFGKWFKELNDVEKEIQEIVTRRR